MSVNTMYLRITNSKGKSHIESRQVWDAAKFLESVVKQYASIKDDPSTVEVTTREEYLASIAHRRRAA